MSHSPLLWDWPIDRQVAKVAATFEFAPQIEIAQALDSGESVIWSGTPRKGLVLP